MSRSLSEENLAECEGVQEEGVTVVRSEGEEEEIEGEMEPEKRLESLKQQKSSAGLPTSPLSPDSLAGTAASSVAHTSETLCLQETLQALSLRSDCQSNSTPSSVTRGNQRWSFLTFRPTIPITGPR